MADDSTLLRRYIELRDETAFSELVGRHIDGVYSIARRRVGGDNQLAADVAQDVFLALARRAQHLTNHPALVGWLYTATRNIAANLIRSERGRFAREQKAHAMHQLEWDAADPIDWSTSAPLLEEALDTLRANDRLAVLMRFIERRPFAEIGAVLSLSEDAARKRVDRAVEKLRAALARRGIICSTAALSGTLAQAVSAAPAGLAASIAGQALTAAATAGGGTSLFVFLGLTKLQMAGVAALVLVGGLALVSRPIASTETRSEPSVPSAVASQSDVATKSMRRGEKMSSVAQTPRGELASPPPRAAIDQSSPMRFVPMAELTNRGRQTPLDAISTFYWATWALDHEELAKSIVLEPAYREKAEELFARIPTEARTKLKVRTAEEMWALAFALEMTERYSGLAINGVTPVSEDRAQVSLELQANGRINGYNRVPLQRGENGWQLSIVDGPGPNHLLEDIRKKFLQELLGQNP